MLFGGGYIDYFNYAIPLWILSGFLILKLDVQHYENSSMNKEKKVAKFIGWFNLWLALCVFIGNWALRTWVWQ